MISPGWDDAWIEVVRDAEREKGRAICGAKKVNRKQREEQTPIKPCLMPAGAQTEHVGEGRCKFHGGTSVITTGRWSLLRHHQMKNKVEALVDNPDLMNIRSAVATSWAVLDTLLEEESVITPDRAQEIVSGMARISTMIKQHHDITEGQKITIEVPQFMEWAEHLYELAIKYILATNGDVRAFLAEAQQYYSHAVGIVIGDSPPAIGSGDPVEAEDLLRSGEPIS